MAVDLNMKIIVGIPLKLLFSIMFLKCNYVNACVVTRTQRKLFWREKACEERSDESQKEHFHIVTGLLC